MANNSNKAIERATKFEERVVPLQTKVFDKINDARQINEKLTIYVESSNIQSCILDPVIKMMGLAIANKSPNTSPLY